MITHVMDSWFNKNWSEMSKLYFYFYFFPRSKDPLELASFEFEIKWQKRESRKKFSPRFMISKSLYHPIFLSWTHKIPSLSLSLSWTHTHTLTLPCNHLSPHTHSHSYTGTPVLLNRNRLLYLFVSVTLTKIKLWLSPSLPSSFPLILWKIWNRDVIANAGQLSIELFPV